MNSPSTVKGSNEVLLQAQNIVFELIINNAPNNIIFSKISESLDKLCPGVQTVVHEEDEHLGIIETELGSWSIPIQSASGKMIGYITFYHVRKGFPDPYEFEFIKAFANIASMAVEKRRLEQKYLKSEELSRLVANNISDLVNVIDLNGEIVYASPSHLTILGLVTEEIVGKDASNYLHPEDQIGISQYMSEIILHKTAMVTECRIRKSDGEYIVVESRGVPVSTQEGTIEKIVIVSRDITSRKHAEETIRFMAYHDSLTSLPNRRKFKEKLEKMLVSAKKRNDSFCLLFIDLDNFKTINDTYGHEAGDHVLIKVANRLRKGLTENQFISRWGGDEFAILVNSCDHSKAYRLAEELLNVMDKPFVLECCEVRITPSIGVSTYPRDGEDLKSLIDKADKAMYRVKDSGKNNVTTYSI
ncbi:diguanylate cyclase domain-containing protein [Bacillus sp. DJP31]|uniref:sensor domain-containing diguanylate cyclase n=1 Tax=Bacillus sp. DJP31 TaxID=3409789 RepID=UPI003BB74AB2